MEFEEPWMAIYPKPYMDIPLITLKDKYLNILKEYYEKEKYVAVIDIKTYLKNGIFPLSTTIKFLLSVLPRTCQIIRMKEQENNTFLKFKLEDTNKKIYMFYIFKISLYKSKIIMIYNTEKLEKTIESIDDFNNTFIKIIYGDKIINNELIKKAFDYCVEVKFRMAIFLFWIIEPNNIIYTDEYNKLNNENNFIINISKPSEIEEQIDTFSEIEELLNFSNKKPIYTLSEIKEPLNFSNKKSINYFENTEETFEFYDLLNILKNNEKVLSKKEIEKKEIEKFNVSISEECPICLEKLATGFYINMSCCNISYHLECIKIWFDSSNSCPNCLTLCKKDELKNFLKKLKNLNKKKKSKK
jgi:hypothetical protein